MHPHAKVISAEGPAELSGAPASAEMCCFAHGDIMPIR